MEGILRKGVDRAVALVGAMDPSYRHKSFIAKHSENFLSLH